MPKLNLFLDADARNRVTDEGFDLSVFGSERVAKTKAQRLALHCILSNIAKYKFNSILFEVGNRANPHPQYNPHGYGHKPLVAVIKQLQSNGLLILQVGTRWLLKREDGDLAEPKLSEFQPTPELVELTQHLGYSAWSVKGNSENHIELRSKDDRRNPIPFEETPYSKHTNELMAEYCEYINRQKIEVDGEDLGDIHLVRNYKDWRSNGKLRYGGRTYHPFMGFKEEKRLRITINGSPVAIVDYPASLPNVLYRLVTGRFLETEDPYEVKGVHRKTVKFLMNMMINNGSVRAAARAANKNIAKQKSEVQKWFEADHRKFRSLSKIMALIAERNAPIAECFFRGKIHGQRYAWHEQNLVFEVARLLARMDVPALTVHDEFIVPVDMVQAVHEVRYTTAFQDVW